MVGAGIGSVVGAMVGAGIGCIVGATGGAIVGCVPGGVVDASGVGPAVGVTLGMVKLVGEALGFDVGEARGLEGATVGASVAGINPSYMSKPGANTKGVQILIQQKHSRALLLQLNRKGTVRAPFIEQYS